MPTYRDMTPEQRAEHMRDYRAKKAAESQSTSLSPDMVEAERLRVIRDKKKSVDPDLPIVVRETPVSVATKQPPIPTAEFDPHQGHPVGYRHDEPPQWKRTSKDTWSLNDGTWTWDGKQWVGGGARLGLRLGYPSSGGRRLTEYDGVISPANEKRSGRPLSPGAAPRS